MSHGEPGRHVSGCQIRAGGGESSGSCRSALEGVFDVSPCSALPPAGSPFRGRRCPLVAAALAFFHGGSAGATTLKTFATPGSYTWKVPTGVTGVTFDVLGARGGSVLQNSGGVVNVISSGGAGGEAKARLAVHAGEVFEIVVGGQGGSF